MIKVFWSFSLSDGSPCLVSATPHADTEAAIINNNSPKINFLVIILTSKTLICLQLKVFGNS